MIPVILTGAVLLADGEFRPSKRNVTPPKKIKVYINQYHEIWHHPCFFERRPMALDSRIMSILAIEVVETGSLSYDSARRGLAGS